MFDGPDYELRWPTKVFADELREILQRQSGGNWSTRVSNLLGEAFSGEEPRNDFRASGNAGFAAPSMQDAQWTFAAQLLQAAPSLRQYRQPRPYYPQRIGSTAPAEPRGVDKVHRDFAALIAEFEGDGYLASAFPKDCVDDRRPVRVDPDAELTARLGRSGLWPLRPDTWDQETFYGLIEVFHDLVARPRDRSWHDYSGCGWHYSGFARDPARAIYRWRVNALLSTSTIELRLAEEGEDVGRLVHVSDEGRTELVERALGSTNPTVAGRVAHAIALFRSRGSTEHDKRSAIVTLAGILEERRRILKESLFSKDEGALFEIANGFALRHQSESQKADYDQAFLDWVFWWYLATVELTDRLMARDTA